MSFGKIFGDSDNGRTIPLLVVAKANNLDVEFVETVKGTTKIENHPLGKIPAFEGADGYRLHETIAIAIYLTSQNERTTLLGKTKQDYASILKWMSFANMEIVQNSGHWALPLLGKMAYNKKNVDDAAAATLKAMAVLEQYLLINTYLVGERLSLADIFVAATFNRGVQSVFDKKFRDAHPNVTRWYNTIVNQEIWSAATKVHNPIEEAVKYTPPPKAEQPKKEKVNKEPAPPAKKEVLAAGGVDDEEEEPAVQEPKAKHPLEALGKPGMILDDWKRKYSNEETREVALPWFWEHYNPADYSLWQIDYKYNDELTLPFMSNNLIGGFFNRLEGSRKYLFGAASVYGVANDSVIRGAFLVRGNEALPAFDVAPDYESYSYTKLDATSAADKEFIASMWAWDKPIEANGKTYEHADGKVFK